MSKGFNGINAINKRKQKKSAFYQRHQRPILQTIYNL